MKLYPALREVELNCEEALAYAIAELSEEQQQRVENAALRAMRVEVTEIEAGR